MTDHATDTVDEPAQPVNDTYLMGYDLESFLKLKTRTPQPFLDQYATECPVRTTPDGGLFFLRMGLVRKVQQHPASTALPPDTDLDPETSLLGNERPLIPLQIDGELHRAYRRLLDPLFSPKRVAPLAPAIRELADELIDKFIERGSADVYGEFCAILPATVFVRLMGIPESDISYFMSFKNDLLRTEPDEPVAQMRERVLAASKRCYGYFSKVLEERAASGETHDDLIGWFMTTEVEGRRLTREDILDITYLLMIAGLDTVAASLSCFLAWLAQHPQERAAAVADPTMWPRVVEELLRFETPVPNSGRYASRDMQIGDMHVPKGTQMNISWAAANLDPEVFPHPLTVDFFRPRMPHVTFAAGPHRCLGSHLARLELRVALDQFHKRIPDYEITPGAELNFEALPVRLVNPLPLSWKGKA
jgi:cytochrome P450